VCARLVATAGTVQPNPSASQTLQGLLPQSRWGATQLLNPMPPDGAGQ